MRKVIYAFFVFYSLFSAAQEKVKFGINTGITYSDIHGNEIANKNKYDFDFLVGTSLELPLSKKISFFSGLNYERKSFTGIILFSRISNYDPYDPAFIQDSGFKVKATLSYLSIPANIKYYLDNKKSFFIDGGFITSIFINFKTDIAGSEKSLFKTLDFGINLGFGKEIKLNEKVNLNIQIRDNYGLVNISKAPVYNNGTVKTNSVNLIFNWQFKI